MATSLTKIAYPSAFSLYLFCLIFIHLSQQECVKKFSSSAESSANTNSKALTNFEVKQYTLSKPSPTRFSYFTITLGFAPPSNAYQVAPIISTMEGYSDDTGIDFSIRISKNTDSFDAIFFINDKAVWQNIKMNFIVNAREDIRVGTFFADTAPFMMAKTPNKTTVIEHYPSENRRIQSKFIKVQPFIVGLKVQDKNFKLTFGQSKYIKQSNKVSIQVQLGGGSQPLELMFVSYIILVLDSNYQARRIPDLLSLPINKLFFIGITSKSEIVSPPQNVRTLPMPVGKTLNNKGIVIQSQNQVEVNWLSNDTMPQLLKSLKLKDQCITLQYCYKLGGFFTWKINSPSSQSYICQFCGENQTFSYSTEKCQCLIGYSRNFTSSCSLPPKPLSGLLKSTNMNPISDQSCHIKINGKCFVMSTAQPDCPQNSVPNQKGDCVCIEDYLYDQTLKKCIVNPCLDPSAIYRFGRCMCKNANQYYIRGVCKKCELNKVWKMQFNSCVCKQGTIRVGSVCQPCHADAILNQNQNQCKCKTGYIGNGLICRKAS